MEGLSCLLDKASFQEGFGYHWRCAQTSTTHLCFADDLIIFSRGNAASIRHIKKALTDFETLSGLKPSLAKSQVFLSGVPAEECQAITETLGFQLASLPVKYLGVPLITKRLSAADCAPLVEKISRRAKSWTSKCLSYAGRLQLISSVLSSYQAYWASAFMLPARVHRSIDQILRCFLWSGSDLKLTGAKVAWNEVCLPKEEGGLGIRPAKDWNRAAQVKHLWHCLSPTVRSIWPAWVKANLIKNRSFWSLSIPQSSSWVWRKLLQLRPAIRQHIRLVPGNGLHGHLWYDYWLPSGPILESFSSTIGSRLLSDTRLRANAKISAIIVNDQWQWPTLNSYALRALKHQTDSMAPPSQSPDELVWHDGLRQQPFSSSQVWEVLRPRGPAVSWCHLLWHKFKIPRASFFLWLAIKDRLATAQRLQSWGIVDSALCSFCKEYPETRDHLFFQCRDTSCIWRVFGPRLPGCQATGPIWPDILFQTHRWPQAGIPFLVAKLSLAAMVYNIWRHRNDIIHGRSSKNMNAVISCIESMVRDKLRGQGIDWTNHIDVKETWRV